MKRFSILSLAFATMFTFTHASAEDVMVVYDASGSMWGQIDGVSKVEIARDVMAGLVESWNDDTNVGLVAYGHRREGACSDIEALIEPAPISRARFLDTVNGINPRGRTPLSAAVEHAAEAMAYRDNPATVILISDGIENCLADPCALSAQLAEQGIGFATHVIGFDVATDEHSHLACIAENTGGVFVAAKDADELRDALAHVQSVVDLQPMSSPQAVPELEPAPSPSPEIVVTGPEETPIGSRFAVEWSPMGDTRDIVAIVPKGADEGTRGNWQRAGSGGSGELTAPAAPGFYELRYMQAEGEGTLGSAPIEVTDAAITLTGPATVTTGARFPVQWDLAIDTRDIIAIVPMGADEGARGNWQRAGNAGSGELTAPAEPGLYELRYILNEGEGTLASLPIEVETAQISIEGPGMAVRAGSEIEVRWSRTIATQDMIAVVPVGADASDRGDWRRAGNSTQARVAAPDTVGLYEVRYVLNEGHGVLASDTFEVVPADAPLDAGAGLSVPERVSQGEGFAVSWEADVEGARIALARAEQADFTWLDAQSAGAEGTVQFTAPAEPGTYEVRFLDIANQAVLGRAIVEVQ